MYITTDDNGKTIRDKLKSATPIIYYCNYRNYLTTDEIKMIYYKAQAFWETSSGFGQQIRKKEGITRNEKWAKQ